MDAVRGLAATLPQTGTWWPVSCRHSNQSGPGRHVPPAAGRTAVNARDMQLLARSHHRCRWWPWRCRCGLPFPCPVRRVAVGRSPCRIGPLPDGDIVAVHGYPRYADLLPPPPPPAMGRARVPGPVLPVVGRDEGGTRP
jgi:hypothetical protein